MDASFIPDILEYNPKYYCYYKDCNKFNLQYEFACDIHKKNNKIVTVMHDTTTTKIIQKLHLILDRIDNIENDMQRKLKFFNKLFNVLVENKWMLNNYNFRKATYERLLYLEKSKETYTKLDWTICNVNYYKKNLFPQMFLTSDTIDYHYDEENDIYEITI